MSKLSLKADDLRIESFETDAPARGRGTVDAAAVSVTCFCTRQVCAEPTEAGYATYVNNICIRC